jgi:predicted metal-dependent hydrolase
MGLFSKAELPQQSLVLPNGGEIAYQLERSARRTIGLKINESGLVIHAPLRISIRELNAILLTKIKWIQSKLKAQEENRLPHFVWQHNADLLWLGNEIKLSVLTASQQRTIELESGYLTVPSALSNNTGLMAKKVIDWYRKQAKADFERRVDILSAKLGVETPKVYLSNAKSRWGSCNHRREVRLNWRLIQAPPSLINYVVSHELAHLIEMNHSPKFWSIVSHLYPNYKEAEKQLKAWGPKLHQL